MSSKCRFQTNADISERKKNITFGPDRPRWGGLTENAGRENDGPSKLQSMKLQDVKMNDQFAGHENAGHENDGTKMTTGREMEGEKSRLSTEITLQ